MEILHKKFILYLIAAFLISYRLSKSTDDRIVSFIFSYYILTAPILSIQTFMIHIPGLSIDLQANRILLIILIIMLIFESMSPEEGRRFVVDDKRPMFEVFSGLFLGAVVLSLVVNYSSIQQKQRLITVPLEILLFILVYYVAKKRVTPLVFEALIKALVVLLLFSAITAIVQVFDPYFLKTGRPTAAFDGIWRSSGIFHDEYELGFLTNFGMVLFLIRYKRRCLLYFGFPLLFAALITTFHRLDWLICVACYCLYIFLTKGRKAFFIIIACVCGLYVISQVVVPYCEGNQRFKSFEQNRLYYDTVSERFLQYQLAVKFIATHFWGLGGYDTREYYDVIEEHKMIRTKGNPVVVHDGYLAVGVQYGGLAALAFSCMLGSMLAYFIKRSDLCDGRTLCPLFIVFIWILSNISNDMSTFNSYVVVLVALIAGSLVSIRNSWSSADAFEAAAIPGPQCE